MRHAALEPAVAAALANAAERGHRDPISESAFKSATEVKTKCEELGIDFLVGALGGAQYAKAIGQTGSRTLLAVGAVGFRIQAEFIRGVYEDEATANQLSAVADKLDALVLELPEGLGKFQAR